MCRKSFLLCTSKKKKKKRRAQLILGSNEGGGIIGYFIRNAQFQIKSIIYDWIKTVLRNAVPFYKNL